MTRCGGMIKDKEIFDGELDFYEIKVNFIGCRGLPLRGGDEAQAQLVINAYPSQDNPAGQTLWIFSGSSTASASNSIRSSGTSYNIRDSWGFISSSSNGGNIYDANKPSDTNFSLSPLFSSSNAKDIASVNARIPGGGKTDITFAASATNTPTITIAGFPQTIARLWMDEDSGSSDNFGIRITGIYLTYLSYSNGNASSWVGAGIINKPIDDFFAGTFNNYGDGPLSGPNFAAFSDGSVQIVVNSQIIPEPQEYALVFGLFALGFVLFHRHRQRKQRRQA